MQAALFDALLTEAKPESLDISVNLNRTACSRHVGFSGIGKPHIIQVGVAACGAG